MPEKRNYYEMESPYVIAQMIDQPPLAKQRLEPYYVKRKYEMMESPQIIQMCLDQPPTKLLRV